jgi:uncharacterized protein YggL (DUF469 family)
MEIKAELNNATEEQRLGFIVEYSHNQGCEIEQEIASEEEVVDEEGNTTIVYTYNLKALGYTEEEITQAERERIQELSMTRSDFFDGTIMAWGVGQDELLVLIQTLLATLPLPDVKKLIAINNFKNALNFYRKHDLFKILVGMPIQLAENIQLVIEDEHLDKFFDEVAKGNKEQLGNTCLLL